MTNSLLCVPLRPRRWSIGLKRINRRDAEACEYQRLCIPRRVFAEMSTDRFSSLCGLRLRSFRSGFFHLFEPDSIHLFVVGVYHLEVQALELQLLAYLRQMAKLIDQQPRDGCKVVRLDFSVVQ